MEFIIKDDIKAETVRPLLSDLKDKFSELFKNSLKKIILFGSSAKGTYNKDSDIDIMVLSTETEFDKYDDIIADIVVELIGKYSIYPSIFLENDKQYYKNIENEAFFKTIENEGSVLYELNENINPLYLKMTADQDVRHMTEIENDEITAILDNMTEDDMKPAAELEL